MLFPQNASGVAWNGLTSVTEKGDDSPSVLYIDGQIYRTEIGPSTFEGTIEAFMYPDELEPYIGVNSLTTAQPRSTFGFAYRTNSELHLVYNALVSPSNKDFDSVSDSATPSDFSWDFTTLPVEIPGGSFSSHLVIMLDYAVADAISDLENYIYGDDDDEPSLPDPATIIDLFESYTTVRITDNGDGTWTASGPDANVFLTDDNTFEIDWASAEFLDSDTYTVYSL